MVASIRSFTGGARVLSGDWTQNHSTLLQPGDMLVEIICYRGSPAFTVPAGWTKRQEQTIGNLTVETTGSIASIMVATRELTGADSYPIAPSVFTRTGGGVAIANCLNLRGNIPSGAYDTSSSFTMAAAGTNVSPIPALTTAEADELVIAAVAGARNGEISAFVATDPAALVLGNWSGTVDGEHVDQSFAHAARATAGSTGNISATNAVSARHAGAAIAIKSLPSITVSPAVVAAVGSKVDPTVKHGSIVLEPNVVAKGATIAPVVLTGSIIASPVARDARGQVVDPIVSFSSTAVTPAAAAASGIVVDPVVKGELIVAPSAIEARGQTAIELIEVSQGPLFSSQSAITSVWSPQEALS